MAEIFAVEAKGSGDSIPKELSKKRFCGESCSKELRHRWGCRKVRSCTGDASKGKEIGSVGRVIKKGKGEVNEVRVLPGWERVRVQIDSGAIDTVGPKEIAKAFEMKETEMSKRGIGYVAANGSSIKNYGEK